MEDTLENKSLQQLHAIALKLNVRPSSSRHILINRIKMKQTNINRKRGIQHIETNVSITEPTNKKQKLNLVEQEKNAKHDRLKKKPSRQLNYYYRNKKNILTKKRIQYLQTKQKQLTKTEKNSPQKTYYERNKEKILLKKRKRPSSCQNKTTNADKNARQKRYYQRNKEAILSKKREVYSKNKKKKDDASHESRQTRYYYRNRELVLQKAKKFYAENKEDLSYEAGVRYWMQQIQDFKPLQLKTMKLCYCKFTNPKPGYEVTLRRYKCIACLGAHLHKTPEWKESLQQIILPKFTSNTGCVSCGRKNIQVTHVHVEPFMWKNEGWCFDCCRRLLQLSLTDDWKKFYTADDWNEPDWKLESIYKPNGLNCYFCDKTEITFYFQDFQQNMLMCQNCFGVVQFILQAQTDEWWREFTPTTITNIVFSCRPKTDFVDEEMTLKDILWNKKLIQQEIILTSGEQTSLHRMQGRGRNRKKVTWTEWVYKADQPKSCSLNPAKNKDLAWSRALKKKIDAKERKKFDALRCPNCNKPRTTESKKYPGTVEYGCSNDFHFPHSYHYISPIKEAPRCWWTVSTTDLKNALLKPWSKERSSFVKGRCPPTTYKGTQLESKFYKSEEGITAKDLNELCTNVENVKF